MNSTMEFLCLNSPVGRVLWALVITDLFIVPQSSTWNAVALSLQLLALGAVIIFNIYARRVARQPRRR